MGSKPFRFQAMWLSHPHYANIVSSSWDQCSRDLLTKLKGVSLEVHNWAKRDFGKVFRKKRHIQKALDRRYNPFLVVDA